MKISIRFLVLIGFLIPFIFISCKTTDDGLATGLVDPGRISDILAEDMPAYARNLQNTLATAREDAVNAGAEDLVPDRFALVDELADSSRQHLENGNYAASIIEGREALERYEILQTLGEAREIQRQADEQDFFTRDPDTYIQAAEAGNYAVDFFDEGNLAESQKHADEALAYFMVVYNNGWQSIAEDKADVANDWRDAATEIRANVAVQAEFAAAEQTYNNAQTAMQDQEYVRASELYEQSGMLFMLAHDNTVERRNIAEEALRVAEERLLESEERAQYVHELLEGGD